MITNDPQLTPNINDNALYTQNRYYNTGISGGSDSFDYKFNVIAGEDYTIRLGFADNYGSTDYPGGRILSYSIDGVTEASNFCIAKTSGANFPTIKAVEEDYSNIIAPSNGVLDLTFSQGSANNAQINAIQVLSESIPASAAPEPSQLAAIAFRGLGIVGLRMKARKRSAQTLSH